MAPSRVVGGLSSTSSTSGIFFQNDVHSHNVVNSHLAPSFVNIPNSVMGPGCSNLIPVSGDVNNAVLSSVANSGPSIGASSLVTDANSALTGGGQHLQRSGSNNTESYPCLPASPISFSSNNISISGSSVMDGSPVVQLNTNQDHNPQAAQQCQQQHQGISGATSIPSSQINHNQVSLPMVTRGMSAFIQDPNSLTHIQKKSRMDMKQEDILQQQVIQHLLQRQDSMQMQGHNPQLQALLQQQRIRQQQQQILQSMPQMQRAQLQQQQQMQLRHHLQQQGLPSLATMKRPVDSGVCARRLMQYLYHQRQRPPDNSIAYWRKFVAEYFSPRAKKRWCLSLYENVGHHALGVFPQDAWHCDICNSKSGRGFEATFEVLPRLSEIKFSSGVTDELLFLDLPREVRFPSGILILEYAKAVQESVYEQLRVIREGQLRITFTPDLKILYWEFCGRRHEELLPRRLVAPQVNQLVQAAQKCKSSTENGSEMTSQQDLQTNSNLVLAAGHQLAKCLELQSLNDLGFSKRYVRCLQIAEVVNSMKDLIDFCKEHKVGPIDGLKNYPQHATMNRFQMPKMQEMEQQQVLPTDRNVLNKLMALQPGQNQSNPHQHHHHQHMVGRGAAPNALSLTNYQNLLMRQNSINSNMVHHSDPSSPINGPYHGQSAQLVQSPMTSYSPTAFPAPQQHQQQHLQRSPSVNSLLQQTHQQPTGQVNQALQQHMIQQLLQDINNGGAAVVQQQNSLNGGGRNTGSHSRSNSFKADSSVDTAGFGQKVSHNISLTDEDLAHDFADNGFFNSVLDDSMGYAGWKG